ncbi:MAG: hypothetical protein DRH89_09340, partial [Candidatus Cloacimonadota bacterium]
MKGVNRTNEQLLKENEKLKSRIAALEKLDSTRRQTEVALKESKEKQRLMIDNSPVGFSATNLKGKFIDLNNTMCNMLGYSRNEMLHKHFNYFTHPDDRAENDELFETLVDGKTQYFDLEKRYIHKSGKIIYALLRSQLVHDEKGKPLFEIAVVEDITERKKAEEALKESEEKYRNLVERANDGICIIQDMIVKYLNSHLAEMWGSTVEEVIGTKFTDYIHPDELPKVINRYQRRIEEKRVQQMYQTVLQRKNGSSIYVELNAGLITYKGEPADLVIVRDISERKQAEKLLKESEKKYRKIFEEFQDLYYKADLGGILLDLSPSIKKISGFEQKELIGKSVFKIYKNPPERIKFMKALKKHGFVEDYELTLLGKDGKDIEVSATSHIIFDKNKKAIGVEGVLRDITKRKIIEERIKFLSSFVEQSSDGMAIADINGFLLYTNKTWAEMHGYKTSEELLGKNLSVFHSDEQLENEVIPFNRKVTENGFYRGEVSHIRKNGEIFPTMMTTTMLNNDHGEPIAFAGIAHDITERKLAEEKIKHQNSFLTKVMDSLSHPFYVIDAKNYNILMANSVAGFDLTSDDKTCHCITHNSDKPCNSAEHRCPLEIVKKTKKSALVEHIHFDKNGNPRNVEIHGYPIFDNNGEIIQMIEYCLDITERKKAEEALINSEERLKIIFESAPDAYYLTDLKGTFLDGNKAAEDLLGYKREELLGKSFLKLKLLSASELLRASKLLLKNVQSKGTGPDEFILNRKNGSKVTVEIRTYPVIINNKTVILGIAHDISERKKREEILYNSEQRLSLHFNQNPLGVIEWDLDFKVKKWNPAAEKIFGYSQKQALGKHAEFIIPELDKNHVDHVWKELLANKGGTRSTNKNIKRDGKFIICDWYNTPLINEQGKVVAVASTVDDISKRIKADTALRNSEYQLRESQKVAHIGSYVLDIANNSWKSSAILDDIFGIDNNFKHDIQSWLQIV